MKLFASIIFLILCISIYSQNTSEYIFLKRDSNYFKLWNRNALYDSLFEKFNRLQISGNEQIKILHIGDSHIQADKFTSQVRRHFASNFFHLLGTPAIGFPYSIYKSNQPVSIRVECTGNWKAYTSLSRKNYTPIGITAYTNDSCANKIMLSVNKKLYPNTKFNFLTLITNAFDSTIHIKNPILNELSLEKLNDSIVLRTYSLKNYADSIILNIQIDTLKPFCLYGIIPFNDDPGIVYHTIGINGAKAATYQNTLIADFIALMKYDWLIISLGTNDIYNKNIDSADVALQFKLLVQKIKEKNPTLPILLTTPMEHYYKRKIVNTNVTYIKEVLYTLAKEEGCAIWDLYETAGAKGSMHHWFSNNLTNTDKLHLNTAGYQLVGDLFFEAFMNTYLNGFLEK